MSFSFIVGECLIELQRHDQSGVVNEGGIVAALVMAIGFVLFWGLVRLIGKLFRLGLKPDQEKDEMNRVEKTTDDEKLVSIAERSEFSDVRAAAIRKIESVEILTKLLTYSDDFLRSHAVKRISDQKTIARVAQEDSSLKVREAAIVVLTDREILTRLALFDADPLIRICAITRIDDQTVTEKIAREDASSIVRATAVGKLVNSDVLSFVAENDSDSLVRQGALRRNTFLHSLSHRQVQRGTGNQTLVKFGCSSCGAEITSPHIYQGTMKACPVCGELERVP